ncbi:helix-turn-helix transcriptional regulator [Brevibacillus dissolubilis]|uniref:helix-turn-helix transcriptional regulator n=1 Tax=Brevibacillus dissolubilis TaxID=1844116 RepID=UPI001115B81C|nr:AraC family transcriptional regulator [Brevibacillus dissolubilis]
MKIDIEAKDWQDTLYQLVHDLNMSPSTDGFQWSFTSPRPVGEGKLDMHFFPSGIGLMVGDVVFYDQIDLDLRTKSPMVTFGFMLHGRARRYIYDQQMEYIQEPQSSHVSYNPGHRNAIHFPGQERCTWVKVFVPGHFFRTTYKGLMETLPQHLQTILLGNENQYLLYSEELTSPIQSTMSQILDCPYRQAIRSMYLEAKSLEVISYFLDHVKYCKRYQESSLLNRKDKELTTKAAEILLSNMEQPPSMVELSQMVYLNQGKLQKCFKQLYGMTVFQYLHEKRMEKAKCMLEEGRLSVTEVAEKVGYEYLNNFSLAFKKRYGVTPKLVKK